MVKTNKHKPVKGVRRGGVPEYQYESMVQFMSSEFFISPHYIEKFADEQLRYFCDNKDARYINEFYLKKGLIRKTYRDWLERSPYLKERHKLCKELIGLRREKAMEKANPLVLRLRQYQYDEGFGKAEERIATIKAKADRNNNDGQITFKITTDEAVDSVKERLIDSSSHEPQLIDKEKK